MRLSTRNQLSGTVTSIDPGSVMTTVEVDVSGQDNGAVCGNGQKIACCNSGEDLIGANCLSIPIRTFPSRIHTIT